MKFTGVRNTYDGESGQVTFTVHKSSNVTGYIYKSNATEIPVGEYSSDTSYNDYTYSFLTVGDDDKTLQHTNSLKAYRYNNSSYSTYYTIYRYVRFNLLRFGDFILGSPEIGCFLTENNFSDENRVAPKEMELNFYSASCFNYMNGSYVTSLGDNLRIIADEILDIVGYHETPIYFGDISNVTYCNLGTSPYTYRSRDFQLFLHRNYIQSTLNRATTQSRVSNLRTQSVMAKNTQIACKITD